MSSIMFIRRRLVVLLVAFAVLLNVLASAASVSWSRNIFNTTYGVRQYATCVQTPVDARNQSTLVLIGGQVRGGNSVSDIFRGTNAAPFSNIVSVNFTRANANSPPMQMSAAAANSDGSVLMIGGTNAFGAFNNTVYYIDPALQKWTLTLPNNAAAWTPRVYHAVTVINALNTAVMVTGYFGSNPQMNSGDASNVTWISRDGYGAVWSRGGVVPYRGTLYLSALVSIPSPSNRNGSLLLIGGLNVTSLTNNIFISTDASMTWARLPSDGLPSALSFPSAQADLNGIVYVSTEDTVVALYVSTDQGRTFITLTSTPSTSSAYTRCAGLMYAMSARGPVPNIVLYSGAWMGWNDPQIIIGNISLTAQETLEARTTRAQV